ncbi:MAG: HI0074 family nucleotidyltransferase substrate-binding subunit [Bdellovibrionales bacterium]
MAEVMYKNFEIALTKLDSFIKNFNQSEVERAGIIQAFEFTFEQSWKALQKQAGSEGVNFASPKKAFQWALESGLIEASDEQIWLSMLDERNLTSHTYREAIAIKVLTNIQNHYLKVFHKLLQKLKA